MKRFNTVRNTIFDMSKLSITPKTWSAEEVVRSGKDIFFTEGQARGTRPSGVSAIWYESEKYHGKPTQVFAWLGIPEVASNKKLPAVILVHGGGGTAFAKWVAMWNRRGYIAIAVDTCGNIPQAKKYGKWNRHENSGPNGCGDFENIDLPIKEQWTYHAVSAVIKAHSLLRTLPQVDKNKVGICGLSWGGYLTSIVIGVDHRLKFAVSIYGCGFLDQDSAWGKNLETLGPKRKRKWLQTWDPSNYLPDAKLPTLWVSGSNDPAYNLKMLDLSQRCHGGNSCLSVYIRYFHSHIWGWKRPETAAFIDSICGKKKKGLIRTFGLGQKNGKAFARYDRRASLDQAWLCYTTDDGKWQDRYWRRQKAVIENGRITSEVPRNATACFFNLVNDDDGCKSSSSLIHLKP